MKKKLRRLLLVLSACCFVALIACDKKECIDCADKSGTVFTFCDPPESPLDSSLTCGKVYTD